MRSHARKGDHNLICDYSGQKIKRSQARRTWDGFIVKSEFWEARHPQDFVRGVPDNPGVVDSRPEAADVFLSAGDVTADDL